MGKNIISSIVRGFAILVIMTIIADPTNAIKYDNTKDLTWIMVFGAILAFFAAYGIGANDVANSFSSSVGAKSLTMPQAVVLASIFEFLGAVLMGSSVSQTMRKGIADPLCFVDNPGLFMYGMTIVCMMVGIWLILATYCELPVSTTHSAVGGIIGMTMMSKGVDCVIWVKEKDSFPFFAGVSAIVFSWVWSPLVSGRIDFTFYLIIIDSVVLFFQKRNFFNIIVIYSLE
jgi:sodium-dependent phosphate transporter